MSIYKKIAETEDHSRITSISSVVDSSTATNLGLVPGIRPTFTLGSGLALAEWTTLGVGLVEGERLVFDLNAPILAIASTSASDTAAGVGARSCAIDYIDADGNAQIYPVVMNGQTPVDMVGMQAVNNIFVTSTGGTTQFTKHNLGTIRVGLSTGAGGSWSAGEPSEIFNLVGPEYSVSRVCWYMAPKGFRWKNWASTISTDATVRQDNAQVRVIGYSAFGSEVVNYRGVDLRLVGSVNLELRGLPFSTGTIVSTTEVRSDRVGGIDMTCSETGVLVDQNLYPNAF